MKYLFILFALFVSVQAEILDFHIMGIKDCNVVHSTTIKEDFKRLFGESYDVIGIILIESDVVEDKIIQRQDEVLHILQEGRLAELGVGIVTVLSLTNHEPQYYYYVPVEEAEKLAGKHKGFRVTVLDNKGKILMRSSRVLSEKEIYQALKEQ
ncbi:hypothetical protein [Sulfurimonas sp.]|uniref:hypothetical protein n=1 Tax=Sulfurimonas sp. TaxID=2022749 RepID=UPI002B4947D2|nr:hypothetical protein [Sulfurimonas sp.]